MVLSSINILYDVSIIYDHFPSSINLCIKSKVAFLVKMHVNKESLVENFVDWRNFNATRRKKYEIIISALFSNKDICTNSGCSIDRVTHLDNAYGTLVRFFHHATKDFKMTREKKFKVIPGCNVKRNIRWQVLFFWLGLVTVR